MFERIVVAVDGSAHAKQALSVACEMSAKFGSELHLVHSPQLETTAIAMGAAAVAIAPSAEEIETAGRRVLEEAEVFLSSAGCSSAQSVIGTHDPATDILNTIEAAGADLVVMGRRGLGGLSSLVLGSVSQKVSHQATCTCMTVH